jgi:hypothetical protein
MKLNEVADGEATLDITGIMTAMERLLRSSRDKFRSPWLMLSFLAQILQCLLKLLPLHTSSSKALAPIYLNFS